VLRDIFRKRDRGCDFAQARHLVFYERRIEHRRKIALDMSRNPQSHALGEGEMQQIEGCATPAVAWMRKCTVV